MTAQVQTPTHLKTMLDMAKPREVFNRFITQTASPGAIRKDKFQGKDFIVVPVVALREGVFQCATCDGPELYLAKEFAGQVESWNGRPVTFGHPERNGQLVSAGSADVHEHDVIGIIFNAELDGDKLKVEAWLDISLIDDPDNVLTNSDEISETIKRLQDGEQVEISTGYFANVRPSTGKFNGKAYQGVQTSVLPDHLAILSEGTTGACSWKDGCGAPRLNANEDACCTECDTFRDDLRSSMVKILTEHGELSDTDRRRALESVLNNTEEFRFAWVIAVFSESFVFEHNGALWRQSFNIGDDGVVSLGDDMVQVRPETEFVDVKTNEETTMDKEQVVTSLIANKASKFTDDNRDWLMSLEEEQLELLAPVEAAPTETPTGDPGSHNAPVTDPSKEEDDNAASTTGTVSTSSKDEVTPISLQDYVKEAPVEIQEVLNQGVALQREQKAGFITGILANKRCKFTQEELEGKGLDELKKLAELSDDADYSIRPNAGSLLDNSDSDAAPEAPDVFDLGKNADAA